MPTANNPAGRSSRWSLHFVVPLRITSDWLYWFLFSIRYLYHVRRFARHTWEFWTFVQRYSSRPRRILEIGAGSYVMLAQFCRSVSDVVVMDTGTEYWLDGKKVSAAALLPPPKRSWLRGIARHLHPSVAFQRLLGAVMARISRNIDKKIRDCCAEILRAESQSERRTLLPCVADAERLCFRRGAFDLVVSRASFEHIADIDAAARQIAHVLSDGGIAVINAHLFSSLSGGHHRYQFLWDPIPSSDPCAWDHLMPGWSGPVPLNRLRLRQYVEVFERYFEILELRKIPEIGRHLLTDQLRARCADYTIEELTTRELDFVLRKKGYLGHASGADKGESATIMSSSGRAESISRP